MVRSGAEVVHIGCVGNDGESICQSLAKEGIDLQCLETREGPNGDAIIQLDMVCRFLRGDVPISKYEYCTNYYVLWGNAVFLYRISKHVL